MPSHNHAFGGQFVGFVILRICADISDMRKGKGDILPGIGWIAHDFLIAGHCRVETQFANRCAASAEASPVKDRMARQYNSGSCHVALGFQVSQTHI